MAKLDELPKRKGKKIGHVPNDLTRQTVELHARVGTPQELIGSILGISSKTLRKHYREELDHSLATANAEVCGKLFSNAVNGDPASIFFWLKTRAGFKEAKDSDQAESNDRNITINIVDAVKPDAG